MKASTGSRGFTLVEVMVALSILSLVLLATVTGLRTLGNTQAAIERKTSRVDEVRSVSGFLRDLMESAVVGSGSGGLTLGAGGQQEATYFNFGKGFLEWKTTVLFGEAYGGTHYVRVGQEGGQLMLRWLATGGSSPNARDWSKAASRPLVRDLELFAIGLRQEFDQGWVVRWAGGDPPALVRLQIKAAGKYWPDLILKVQR